MKPYIFTERNKIHIIDLQKTVKALEDAFNLTRDTVANRGTMLFVGTKRQAQDTIQSEAMRCGMPYVTARWLGGMLTNWRTIQQRIRELERLEQMREKGDFDLLTKKEALLLNRKIDRLDMLLGGIRAMTSLPNLLFIVDVHREETAIHEANLLDIPVVGMVDTNCDPTNVDYVIPSNDDAIRAIKLVVGMMADAVLEGMHMRKGEGEELPIQVPAAFVPEEPELADEDLLGEATLRKLSTMSKEELAKYVEEDLELNLEAIKTEDEDIDDKDDDDFEEEDEDKGEDKDKDEDKDKGEEKPEPKD
jgi:small subunit ribosomal protein S2